MLQGTGHSKPSRPSNFRRDKNISKVNSTMNDPNTMGGINRCSNMMYEAQYSPWLQRSLLSYHHIKGLSCNIFLCKIRNTVLNAGSERRDDTCMRRTNLRNALKRPDENLNLLRYEIELEGLDCNQAVTVRIVCPKHGTENTKTNLVHDPIRSECTRS